MDTGRSKLDKVMEAHAVAVEASVARASCSGSTSLRLASLKIIKVPESVFRLRNLSVLLLNNNSISSLPAELLSLHQLTELNLGNNAFKEFPAVLSHLESLEKLYLYTNQITVVPPDVIGGLRNLLVLNLNRNYIERLPPEIKVLKKLKYLSLMYNKLTELPVELGHLASLTEINLTYNELSCLPEELYNCQKLTKIHAARNKLASLPEGITKLTKLRLLDVGGNNLHMFPIKFHLVPLRVLYCEGNRFVQCHPAPSEQEAQILSLKELAARFILQECRYPFSVVHRMLPLYPQLTAQLARANNCAICSSPVLTTWLECVHFVQLKTVMKIKKSLVVPVRAVMCSYKCFNTDGHSYYGISTGPLTSSS